MTILNILAIQNTALLRALAADATTSKAELASLVGQDRSNLNRSIARLAEAGLIRGADDGERELSADGKAQLAAIDRAEAGSADAPTLPPGIRALRHDRIMPDPDQARRDWDSPEALADLEALADDIRDHDLLQNLMVRRVPTETGEEDLWMLDGGERRWRAIGMLIERGDWPADRLILCREIEADDLGHRLAALSENLKRRNLNPLEKARAFDGLAAALADQGVEPDRINREIADRVGVTIEHVQQHRAFMKLDDADQERLTLSKDDPKRLTVRDARQKLARQAEKDAAWSPLQLPADDQLIVAELVHAVRAKSSYLGSTVAVAAEARENADALRLAESNLITLSDEPHRWGEDAGHYRAGFYGWGVSDACRGAWPALCADDEDARHDALANMQRERAKVPPEGCRYTTPWLNGPFALSPEGQAVVDEEAEKERVRNEAAANRASERAAAEARWAEARRAHLAVLESASAAPPVDLAEVTATAAGGVDAPLPWTLVDDGSIVDANGDQVTRFGNHYGPADDCDLTLGQIIVVAVNTAAGLPTPPIRTQGAEDEAEATCRICGCTEDNACVDDGDGPCGWAEPDLCTACVGKESTDDAETEAKTAEDPEAA